MGKDEESNGRRTCVVVDGYSASVPLARMIAERGLDVVHVQSSDPIYFGGRTFRPSDYLANVIFDGDFPKLLRALARFEVTAVTPGVQTGVVLAERIGEALGLATNAVAQRAERMDKFGMFRVLDAHGLLCARSCASGRVEDLLGWFRRAGVAKAIVKPCTSAGTDHVTICHDEAAVRAAFERIINRQNRMGLRNDAVVVQEFLEGTEYIVNTVSYKGAHRATDCWRYRKVAVNGSSFVYEKCELLDFAAPEVAALTAYAFRVLDAFGVTEGASHNEIMMTAEGPALIEINPRLAGAQIPRIAALAVGEAQLEWTVKALLERDRMPVGFREPYDLRQRAMLCPLISNVEGTFTGLRFKEELEALPSFQFADYFVEVGQTISLTVDCFTQPGIVFLVHPSASVLEADYERVRQLERDGLFNVAA